MILKKNSRIKTSKSSTTLAYYGTAYNLTRLPGNLYYNSIITGFSEVFGNVITLPFIKLIGVKKTAICLNFIAGISMIVTLVLLEMDSTR